jgi:type I restriction enzyme R subunit
LRRQNKGELVLVSRSRAALEKLNLALPLEAITATVDELTRDRSAMSLVAANREVYPLLKDGVKVSIPDRERGGQKTERLAADSQREILGLAGFSSLNVWRMRAFYAA